MDFKEGVHYFKTRVGAVRALRALEAAATIGAVESQRFNLGIATSK
jgi:hypothetical protein